MSVNLTDSQEIFLDGVRTDFKIYMMKFLKKLNERPENLNIPTFSDVEWKREANQMLHNLANDVTEIKTNVKNGKSRGRGILNAISHGFGVFKSEAEKLYKD